MALTLAKFNATKNVPGAWPENPVTSPTFLMMIVSTVNCLVDSINLLVQCCGAAAIGVMASIVFKVRNVTGVIMALAPAVAAGFTGISTTTSNNSDLWSWSCSSGADQMQNVNSSDKICMTNVKPTSLLPEVLVHALILVAQYSKSHSPSKSARLSSRS
jgi:hypothetical protein